MWHSNEFECPLGVSSEENETMTLWLRKRMTRLRGGGEHFVLEGLGSYFRLRGARQGDVVRLWVRCGDVDTVRISVVPSQVWVPDPLAFLPVTGAERLDGKCACKYLVEMQDVVCHTPSKEYVQQTAALWRAANAGIPEDMRRSFYWLLMKRQETDGRYVLSMNGLIYDTRYMTFVCPRVLDVNMQQASLMWYADHGTWLGSVNSNDVEHLFQVREALAQMFSECRVVPASAPSVARRCGESVKHGPVKVESFLKHRTLV
jgi:hypothetical protein